MASATVCVRLRVPSFACAFLKWLRTVSSPSLRASAVSSTVKPADACRKTARSLGVRHGEDRRALHRCRPIFPSEPLRHWLPCIASHAPAA